MDRENNIQGITIVTTTWNEKENIQELIRQIRIALQNTPHEIIIVDDNSQDGTLEVAKCYADVAVGKKREGQTKGLLFGAKLAKFPIIVTIDADLENNPKYIPALTQKHSTYDVVIASRNVVPRFSERWAAKTLGKICGVSDFYSNFRAYKKQALADNLSEGETFGGELLIWAKKRGFKIGEMTYEAPQRRSKPRIGGTIRANLRISVATWKCLWFYLF